MNKIKGLILKDLLQLKSYWKTLIIYTAIFILCAMVYQSPDGKNAFIIFMIIFGFGMFAMASFNYDEKAQADSFLLTLPITRKTLILARYILIISATIIGMLVGILFTIAICISLNSNVILPDLPELFNISIVSMFGVGIIEAIQIPCAYKWGAEKGRIYLFIIAAVIIFIVAGLLIIVQNSNLDFTISEIKYLIGSSLPILLIMLTAISYYVSYKFSYQICEDKE